MHTGKGILALRGGKSIPLRYEFGSDYGDTRAGYLLCDTSRLDPGELFHRLTLDCDDGTKVVLAVMHSGDHYLAVTGRLAQQPERAAA